MALRVLLADESTTIKKVMQLALQDFAVEVKAVHVGVDVLEVTRTYQPDIIFVDVLLQKRNGYEVSMDLKSDSQLRKIPVVLMWSSFMDLDDLQADRSGADRRLEKPFDVENLRQLVLDLVPRTGDQRLAHFLKFPDEIAEPLREEEEQKKTPPPLPPRVEPQRVAEPARKKHEEEKPSWNMESFEDLNSFAEEEQAHEEAPQKKPQPTSQSQAQQARKQQAQPEFGAKHKPLPADDEDEVQSSDDQEPWSHQDLSRFKLDLPRVSVGDEDLELDINTSLGPDPDPQPRRAPVSREQRAPATAAKPARQPAQQQPYKVRQPESVEADEFGYTPPQIPEYEAADAELENVSLEIDELTSEPVPRYEESRFRRTSDEDFRGGYPSQASSDDLATGPIPSLSPERLEEIIRSQSREIIETVVRRVVPDIASDLIRAELKRLLAENSENNAR